MLGDAAATACCCCCSGCVRGPGRAAEGPCTLALMGNSRGAYCWRSCSRVPRCCWSGLLEWVGGAALLLPLALTA
jgi:hypothetical protein